MPWFSCMIHGQNFIFEAREVEAPWYRRLLRISKPESRPRKLELYGFYTTRWVEAEDAMSAENKAIALLWADKTLDRPQDWEGRWPDAPRAFAVVEEINELVGEPESHPGAGYTFYRQD